MIPSENILIIKKEDLMNHHVIESCVIRAKSGDTTALLALFDQYKHFINKIANGIFNVCSDIRTKKR